jgi:hypothetical protein
LLSSFMGVPRVIVAAPTGFMAGAMGWMFFFLLCTLIAIPGLFLLRWLQKRGLETDLNRRSERGGLDAI